MYDPISFVVPALPQSPGFDASRIFLTVVAGHLERDDILRGQNRTSEAAAFPHNLSLTSFVIRTVPPSAGNSGVTAELGACHRFNDSTIYLSRRSSANTGRTTISIALTKPFLAISKRMRLLVVIVIIGVLIWLGWTKPFKQRYAEAKTTITSELNDLQKKPEKKQDASAKRH